jgi:hypothetical protein
MPSAALCRRGLPIESLARMEYYCGIPVVDMFGRTACGETKKDGPRMMLGGAPGASVNTNSCLTDYLPTSNGWISRRTIKGPTAYRNR